MPRLTIVGSADVRNTIPNMFEIIIPALKGSSCVHAMFLINLKTMGDKLTNEHIVVIAIALMGPKRNV